MGLLVISGAWRGVIGWPSRVGNRLSAEERTKSASTPSTAPFAPFAPFVGFVLPSRGRWSLGEGPRWCMAAIASPPLRGKDVQPSSSYGLGCLLPIAGRWQALSTPMIAS